jgi:hypothetical protein
MKPVGKTFCLLIALAMPVMASGFGFKAEFISNSIGPGFGMGLLQMVDLSDFFALYPNIDIYRSTANRLTITISPACIRHR